MIAVLVTDPTQNRQQVTITTGIPSGLTIPELMNSICTGALDATKMITHRMAVDDTEEGYDIFKRAAETGALKVVLTNALKRESCGPNLRVQR